MNNISGFSSTTRITGLTGFDTESMVRELMNAERIPLDSLFQKRTLVEWKRDAYREVTNKLRGLKSTFFDVVNRSSYILSANAVKVLAAKTESDTYLDVSANATAQAGNHQVKVLQVATGDSAVSADPVSRRITGTVLDDLNLSGKSIQVNLDGVSREIVLDDYSTDEASPDYIATRLQASLDETFGSGKLTVGFESGELSIGTAGGATKVSVGDPVSDTESGLEGLGLNPGDSNRIALSDTLEKLQDKLGFPLAFNENDEVQFSINGKLITAQKTESLSQVLDRINNTAQAQVTIGYDELTDKLTLTSKQLGEGDHLTVEDIGGNLLSALGLSDDRATRTEGQDAKILINGTLEVVRSTNQFSVNGVAYHLKKAHPEDSEGDAVTVELDVDTAYDNIKSFVDQYNESIDYLNTKVIEKYDRNYLPLTDAQKEQMKDSDIENWEKQAKTGLLRNDSIIQRLTTAMRTAMYEPVEGTSLTMAGIGIGTTSYLDGGKLTVDENKLREALSNHPDEVAKLLNGVDPDNKTYSRTASSEEKASRYQKSGVFQRISDIIEDNITTYRDARGNKGILLEKAGIEGDITFTDNLMNEEMDDFDDRISALRERLIRKEEGYYRQFSALETYLNQMNMQSAWLAQQFGQGG